MDAPAPTTLRQLPTSEEREAMHRANVRAVLLEDGCDPARIEAAIDEFLDSPPLLQLPSFDALLRMGRGG